MFVDDVRTNETISSGTYVSAKHNVTDPSEGRVDLDTLTNTEATVTWQANVGGSWTNVSSATYTTIGTKTAALSGTSSDEWRVRVDFEKTGSDPVAELGRDAVYFPVSTPNISAGSASPSGGETVRTSTPTLSVDVNDDDLGTAQGDELTLTWRVNGSVVATTTRTTAGTASITAPHLPDGNHTWSVTVNDSYGESTTSSWSFEVAHDAPRADNASANPSGETLHTTDPTLSINVSDPDFPRDGDTVTVEFFINNGTANSSVGTDSLTSNGTASVTPTDLPDGNYSWFVELTDSYGYATNSTVSSFTIKHADPSITGLSPPDAQELTTQEVTFSANVTDSDFAASDGDSLTVEFVINDEVVATEVLSSNGTVSTTRDYTTAVSWYVRVTDQYGNVVTSDERSLLAPDTIIIRNVTTGEPIGTGAEVSAKMYSGELIFEKNTSSSAIDLVDVPSDRGYIIEVSAEGYHTRTTALESVYDQADIYLLSKNQTSSYQEMTLKDLTGEFEGRQTILYIERPVEVNDTLKWEVVAGDYFGSDSIFKTTLEKDQRYRLVIENDDGDRRELGSYIAAVNNSATLEVGQIQWVAPKGDTYQWDAFVDENKSGLVVAYEDPENETTSFDIVVHERGNSSNILFQSSATNLTTYQRTEPLTQSELEQDWAVNITLERTNRTITIGEPISSTASIRTPIPIDERWATLGGLVLLVALAAAFPATLSRVGAVGVVTVATGLSWLGWVDIPMSVIGLSGAVALLGIAASFNDYQ
ncbi:Ig-like domain repeat protein (plasmid) [Haloferax sp. S1W]|uniref:Ig-like domain repeat protein n=1 Tax=Haloferax sp. S1W TaxID=3377110 RepID=UPI0037CAAF16